TANWPTPSELVNTG
uniref:La ribonucleoprotein 1B n=2 Tax=Jaculus jaculus TaxID=51337 RepID=A0A8C5LFX0_JACJA